MKHSNRQKMNMLRLGRRLTALTLVLAMSLPTVAFAVDEGSVTETPTPAEYVVPTITIEANAVVDRWYDPKSTAMKVEDYLTGDLEVAIRVQTGELTDDQKAKGLGFNSLAVALKYSPILTPYKWTLIDGIDLSGKDLSDKSAEERANYKKAAAQPVILTSTEAPFKTLANMQTLKSKQVTEAVGQVSGKEGEGGYLYMEVRSDRPIELKDDTVLAVVTFRYDLTKYQIKAADATNWLMPTVVTPPTGGGGTGGEETGGETTLADIDYDCLLQFATQTELDGRPMPYELMYHPANSRMYYTAGTALADEVGKALELEDPTTSKYQGAPTAGKINFRLVNHTTYNDGGLSLDDLATVLFYDWDDTLIGVLPVPRDGDARKLVNDYVRDNMIHPELQIRRPENDPDWTSNVSSLARADSYRGKYPTTAMSEQDALTDTTMDPEGIKYPLTNKLDYVFLKRPMEKVEGAVDADGNPTNTWRQWGTEEKARWDEDYPYIHGWALIPDKDLTDIQYTHPENVWTTIGVGELASYTGLSFGAYASVDDISKGAAELVSEAKDFTIADFDFGKRVITEDGIQKTNSLKPGSVYAVKAIYEPGVDLQTTAIQYRMISEPYYNKLNYAGSSVGGAYSVDITIERANSDMAGNIRGVARIREPAVRQDTTADIRWDDQYLNNADVEEEQGKGKATYTNVVVDNGEEVDIQLVLSARQNKIDYYLINKYGANFVGGGSRTPANSTIKATAHVLDNYNYKTNTSDESIDGVSADYYDAPYEDRDGSYGFVLFGTLNNLAQKLTEDYNGALVTLDFNNYISANNLNDINLRNHNGDKPSGQNISTFRRALRAALTEAARLHGNHKPTEPGDDDRAWDVEHGYAKFGYHQLQLFVAEYLDPEVTTPVLRTEEEADAVNIKWCHLHEECAAAASGKPRSWEDLIKTAQRTDLDREGKIDVIRLLTMAELEGLAHLRADASGAAFANNRAFAIAFIDAVEAKNTTWDTIQDYIVRGEADTDYAKKTYWWYDGSTNIPLTSLLDTVAAVQDAIFPKAAPGETAATAVVRTAKINLLEPVYDADYASGAVTTAWNNATKNLSITKGTDEGQKFDSWEEFRTKFAAAVRGAENAGVKLVYTDDDDADARAKKLRDYWNKLQYSILHNDTYVANPDAEQQAEMDGYWWYDGAVQVNNLATLIRAAQDANSGKPASMNMFQYAALYDEKNTELHFARNFQGDKYTGDPDTDTENNAHLVFDEFKQDILAYVQEDRTYLRNNAPNWERVQYYLIHGSVEEVYVGLESPYYWWKEGKSAQPVDFTLGGSDNDEDPVARADALAVALLDAAFRATYNGNTVAWDNLTTNVLERGRLVAETDGSEANFPDDFTMVSDLAAFETKIVALMQRIGGNTLTFPSPSANWHQIQYYFLQNSYVSSTDWLIANTNYWWKEKDSNGASPAQLFKELATYLERIAGGDSSAADELRAWYDEEKAEKLEFNLDGFEIVTPDIWGEVPWEDFDYSSCGDPFTVTWAQVELVFAYYAAAEEWYFTDNDEATSLLEDDLGLSSTPPSGTWMPLTARSYGMRKVRGEVNVQNMINNLSARIVLLNKSLERDPSKIEEYAKELEQLLTEIEKLKALLDPSNEATEIPEVTESPEPAETPEVTETPEAIQSPEPAESPEVTETPEATQSPEPAETPEVTETPGATQSPEPTEPPEVETSPEPMPTPNETSEPVGSNTPETEAAEDKESDGSGGGDIETLTTKSRMLPQPTSLYAEMTRWMRTGLLYSGPAGSQKLPATYAVSSDGFARQLLRIGGNPMNRPTLKQNISPPGQRSLSLLLRADQAERRDAE